jgi:uncharacterized protein YjbJ (UPF0337 family)
MNKQQAEGKWRQIKGMAKRTWGKLTNNNAKKVEGTVDKLIGAIQEKFGNTKEAFKEKMDNRQRNNPKQK